MAERAARAAEGLRERAAAADRTLALVLACFFLSGASALVYQTAWTREFAFAFGTSELAVATVLAAYMGGLAAGAALAGRVATRVRRPVLAYGVLELAIGVAALLVPAAMRGATALYVALFAGPGTPAVGGLGTALFYAACAFAILAVPTACMGATLPLLARHAVRDDRELGGRVGLLYAVNALGAVAGTLAAGFVLVPRLGLGPTVGCAVAANALIFGLAVLAARGAPAAPGPAAAAPEAAGPRRRAAPAAALRPTAAGGRAVLALMLVSGAASFTYEVLWTRLLGQLLGASVYAFATMLASFLVGIALGAAAAARLATDRRRAAAGLAAAEAAVAAFSLAALPVLEALAGWAGGLEARTGGGSPLGAAIAGATLLPSTLAIGATFPFAVRIAAVGAEDAGPASARVYAWNTVGAIAGALGAGFALIPALGFAATLAAAALANAALALGALALVPPPRRRLAALALPLAAGLAALWPQTPWRVLRTTPQSRAPLAGELRFFAAGRSTTVLLLERDGAFFLTNNGLPEAAVLPRGAVPVRDATLHGLALLPTLLRPDARRVLVVGLGGGSLLELVPPSVERLDVVELEPEVVAANAAIGPERRADPLVDPRVRVVANDARSALALSGERFDAIVSQPSHPWTAGASHLYTREFFELARSRLREDGVLVQWIGPTYVDEALLRILVATLADAFPHVRVYQARRAAGIVLAGSRAPFAGPADAGAALAAAPEAFTAAGLRRAEDAFASLLLDEEGARRFAAGAPLNTDRRNHLQIRSPRLRAERAPALALEDLVLRRGLAPPVPPGLDRAALVRALLARGFAARARAVAAESPDAGARRLALALVAERSGRGDLALAEYRALLDAGAGGVEARAGLIRVLRERAASEPSARRGGEPGEAALVRAFARLATGEPAAVLEDDAALAALPPSHPLYADAIRVRAEARIASGVPARAREAARLLDLLAPGEAGPADFLARARAAATARDPALLLGSVEALLAHARRPDPAHAGAALALLARADVPAELARRRDDAARRLRATPPPAAGV